MKKATVVTGIAVLVFFAACASGGKGAFSPSGRVVSVPGSRGNGIPAILTLPLGGGGNKFPAVLIAHGHGGSKSENGGFDALASALAEKGIASLRMDFPGCGDSAEDFAVGNRLSFMIDDVNSCKNYLKTLSEIDSSRLGILGYSMGGRIASVVAGRDGDYKSVVLWSPAILPGGADLYVFMRLSGEEGFAALHEAARSGGNASYTNVFGAEQTLGLGWFDDMVSVNPLTEFSGFQGSLLLITGSGDTIIPTENARRITTVAPKAREIRWREVQGADHGYGIYSGESHLTELTVVTSVGFFLDTL